MRFRMPELARPGKGDHPDDSMRIFRPIIFARRFSSMEFCYAISCSRTMEACRACMGTADCNDTDWFTRRCCKELIIHLGWEPPVPRRQLVLRMPANQTIWRKLH